MRLTDNDNGRAVAIATGEELELVLEANPTTGYRWEVSEVDPRILVPGRSKFLRRSGLIGAGGKETLFFKGNSPGRTELRLLFRHPFERGKPPPKEFHIIVTVNRRR